MLLRDRLTKRIHESEVDEIAFEVVSSSNQKMMNELYLLLFDDDRRVSDNAAWVLSHLNKDGRAWLELKQSELIDEAMTTASTTKCRLLLSILLKQTFASDAIRTDFLDYCFENVVSPKQEVGIRSLCVYLAHKQCVCYPELLNELETSLYLLERETLSPGLHHAQKKVLKDICKPKNSC